MARKKRKPHKDQLALFSDENAAQSKIIQNILALRFALAKDDIEHFKELFPTCRCASETFICDYWTSCEFVNNEEQKIALWHDFETEFKKLSLRFALFDHLKKNYFSYLCSQIEENSPGRHYISHTPAGLLYILAGNFEKAVKVLEQAIAQNKHDAQLFGYLGDAYFLKGRNEWARICYREAFEITPEDVDLNFLKDPAVVDLIDYVKAERDDDDDYLTWVVSYGSVERIFPFKYFKEGSSLKPHVQEFFSLKNKYEINQKNDIKAKLFYQSLILSENQNILSLIEEIDVTFVRSLMRELNPLLFSSYLALKAVDE